MHQNFFVDVAFGREGGILVYINKNNNDHHNSTIKKINNTKYKNSDSNN